MRTRTRVEGPVLDTLTWLNADGTNSGTVQCLMHEKSEAMTDVVIPDFVRRSQNGEIFNNPCSYVVEETRASGFGYYYVYITETGALQQEAVGGDVTTGMAAYHGVPGAGFLQTPPIGVLYDSAKAKALSRIDSTPYAFLEDSLEIRETLRLLRNPLYGMRRLSTAFKGRVRSSLNAKGRSRPSRAEAISDAWLEYQFAWAPLVRSAVSIADALADKTMTRPKRRTARGFSEDSAKSHATVTSTNGKAVHFDVSKEVKLDVGAGVLYEVSNPLYDFRFKFGLRLKDIPEGIWAIIPYSFMVDRVVDISGAIRGLLNLLDPSVQRLSSWTRLKQSSKQSIACTGQEPTSEYTIDVQGGPLVVRRFNYQRDPWSIKASDAIPPSDLAGLVSDTTKILDLLALIYRNVR